MPHCAISCLAALTEGLAPGFVRPIVPFWVMLSRFWNGWGDLRQQAVEAYSRRAADRTTRNGWGRRVSSGRGAAPSLLARTPEGCLDEQLLNDDGQDRNLDYFCLRVEDFGEKAIRQHLGHHGVSAGKLESRLAAEGVDASIYIQDAEGNTVELKGPPAIARPQAGNQNPLHRRSDVTELGKQSQHSRTSIATLFLALLILSPVKSQAQSSDRYPEPAIQTQPHASSAISLHRAVHFSSPDGGAVQLDRGYYQVTASDRDTTILLVSFATGVAHPIIAEEIVHGRSLEAPLATSLPLGEDEHGVALYLADGKALLATGSYSGIVTRRAPALRRSMIRRRPTLTTRPFRPQRSSLSRRSFRRRPPVKASPDPDQSSTVQGPDLVLSIDVATRVYTVTNIGNADAVFADSTTVISDGKFSTTAPAGASIPAGGAMQFARSYFWWWACPAPRTAAKQFAQPLAGVTVDPTNKLAETDENNNTIFISRDNPYAAASSAHGDLVVSRITASYGVQGSDVFVGIYVSNASSNHDVYYCEGPVAGTLATLFLDGESKGWKRVGSYLDPATFWNPGDEKRVPTMHRLETEGDETWGIPAELSPGCHTLSAEITWKPSTDPIPESNVDNNSLETKLFMSETGEISVGPDAC